MNEGVTSCNKCVFCLDFPMLSCIVQHSSVQCSWRFIFLCMALAIIAIVRNYVSGQQRLRM